MKTVLIVGAGKVGYYLAKLLSSSGYRVSIMDKDRSACRKVAETLELVAVAGDGTEVDALGDCHAQDADYVVAATGRDEDNLAICLIAKRRYGCPRTIGRIIDPRNADLYRSQGVDATIDATTMAARTIMDIMPADGMRLFSIFETGDVSLAEFELAEDSPIRGRKVSELSLPGDCLLIAVIRAGGVEFPRGSTEIRPNDRVLALARPKSLEALRAYFLGT